jgi:hypothetical protein
LLRVIRTFPASVSNKSSEFGEDFLGGWSFSLAWAYCDPADLSAGAHHKRRRPGDVECIHAESVVDAIGAGRASVFVKENGKGIVVLPEVFLPAEKSIDFLSSYHNKAGVPL